MTRFAGAEKILNRIQDLENARLEGSVPYLTPYMSSQNPPLNESAKGSYFDYVEDKRKELDDIVNSDGGPWKKKIEEKTEEPVVEEEPIIKEEPVDEKSDGLKWAEKAYAAQLAEGATLEQAMKSNPASTPEDWKRAFGKCDTTKNGIPSDCYWPDERSSDIAPAFGKGGGTSYAKNNQAKSRARAAATRNMSAREGKRKATRSQSKSGS